MGSQGIKTRAQSPSERAHETIKKGSRESLGEGGKESRASFFALKVEFGTKKIAQGDQAGEGTGGRKGTVFCACMVQVLVRSAKKRVLMERNLEIILALARAVDWLAFSEH